MAAGRLSCWAAVCLASGGCRAATKGDNVTLIHRGNRFMEQQLDEKAGELLAEHLNARGIDCVLSSGIDRITPDDVTLTNGCVLSATRVVIATGVKPNTALAQASGVPCQRGIVVDGQLRTAVAGISAIGECCEIDGQTWGWSRPVWRTRRCWRPAWRESPALIFTGRTAVRV